MAQFELIEEKDALVVRVVGKFTFEHTAKLRDTLREQAMSRTTPFVVIDLQDCTYIDSSGLGLLVAVRNSLDKVQGTFRLCSLMPIVLKLFDQTNLTNYFQVFTSRETALDAPR